MKIERARRLLDRIGVLRRPCDLDLLVFFARHPNTLLTSEQLAAWMGYEPKQIAESLDLLLDAGLLKRMQNPTHAARMYVFAVGGAHGGWLCALLDSAATREGRIALMQALAQPATRPRGSIGEPSDAAAAPRPTSARRSAASRLAG